MRLTWLPEVLRAAGLTVHEYSGREYDGRTWSNRGSDSWGPIRGITIHETRGSKTSTDAGELKVLVTGSSSAPPPIAQLYLSRTGEWWVVASGRCNHNLTGWDGPNEGYGNSNLLGIEAQHAAGEPWTDRQYRSYVRGVAALVRKLGISVSRVAGHFEHQPGSKTDPAFNMVTFRADVAQVLAGEDDDVSAETVIEGLREVQPYQSAGVGKEAARQGMGNVSERTLSEYTWADIQALKAQQAALLVSFQQLAGRDFTDEPAIVAGVLAGLSPEAIAAAIPLDLADRVADELARRLNAPQG